MTFRVYEFRGTTRVALATLFTFEAAERYVRGFRLVHFEQDADNPGCADALLLDGRVFSIERQED